MNGYLNADAVRAHEERVRSDASATLLGRRHHDIRYRMARLLVLAGARLIHDRPAVIGDSVIVFETAERQQHTDRYLRPAA